MENSRFYINLFFNNFVYQVPGLVNVDFADVRAIMASAGSSLMGIGTATGNFMLVIDIWKYGIIGESNAHVFVGFFFK